MPFFPDAEEANVHGGQFIDIGGDININPANTLSVFDILEPYTAFNAAYYSRDRELEHASICQEGTREDVLRKISAWSSATTGYPVCWLEGPAGSGKSTIAHTIAKQCDDDNRLAFSFFFSRGKQDRSDTTKFVPTFAYQLAQAFGVIQPSLRRRLTDHPSTVQLGLHDQIEKLIILPALTIPRPIQPTVVVIDGLDESSDDDLLCDLIRLLVDTTDHIPFRFLFTSRPGRHIRETFESTSVRGKVHFLSLRDFGARSDIRKYLQLHLSKICDQNDRVMRDVPRPWPSQQALDVLVHQSDGLFIYVSTLVKFVAGGTGLPQERLRAAMTMHTGVDPLYHQVLSVAREFEYFDRVIGTIVFLRHPLTISKLGQLLQLQSSQIRLALDGCQSVLVVPDSDQEAVCLYHASLRGFLTDHSRAGPHFFDPQVYHVSILVACLQLIRMNGDYDGGSHLLYACQNWCYHFSSALSHHSTIHLMNASSNVVMLIKRMEHQWLRIWVYGLEDFSGLEIVCTDCESVVARMMEIPAQWTDVLGSLKSILNVVQTLRDIYIRIGAHVPIGHVWDLWAGGNTDWTETKKSDTDGLLSKATAGVSPHMEQIRTGVNTEWAEAKKSDADKQLIEGTGGLPKRRHKPKDVNLHGGLTHLDTVQNSLAKPGDDQLHHGLHSSSIIQPATRSPNATPAPADLSYDFTQEQAMHGLTNQKKICLCCRCVIQ